MADLAGQSAYGSSGGLWQTVKAHRMQILAVAAAAVVVLIVIMLARYYQKAHKNGFHIAPLGNLGLGGNNPLWQYGAMDAGNWGPVHRDATAWNVAAYEPRWRAGRYRSRGSLVPGEATCEGLAASPRAPGGCGPGEAAVTYREPDGTSSSFCRSFNDEPGPPTVCGAGWDPAASAEAQALATVGSYQHRPYGEKRFMGAVDAAFDANLGPSDTQLETLMHQGGTP